MLSFKYETMFSYCKSVNKRLRLSGIKRIDKLCYVSIHKKGLFENMAYSFKLLIIATEISESDLRTVLFWAITWRVVAIPYRRFATAYLSVPNRRIKNPYWYKLQRSRIKEMDSWSLNMDPISYPKAMIRNFHDTQRNSPERHRYHLFLGESLKSESVF